MTQTRQVLLTDCVTFSWFDKSSCLDLKKQTSKNVADATFKYLITKKMSQKIMLQKINNAA